MTSAMTEQQAITAALFDEWTAIEKLLAGLTPEQWMRPSPLPGWTVHDVAAHIIGTESFLLGEQPGDVDLDVHGLAHVRNEMGAFNERWVEFLRGESPAAMLERFRTATARRREVLAAMSAQEWETPTPSPIGQTTYGRFMRIRVFDCWMHELDIRDAVGVPGDEGTPSAQIAFYEITDSLGYIVGKLGQAPDGSRIALRLTGPLARTVFVAVDGRARVVEALDGPATATITVDSGLFTRLGGGRTTADAHPGAVTIDGDVEVGRRIVSHLAFTF